MRYPSPRGTQQSALPEPCPLADGLGLLQPGAETRFKAIELLRANVYNSGISSRRLRHHQQPLRTPARLRTGGYDSLLYTVNPTTPAFRHPAHHRFPTRRAWGGYASSQRVTRHIGASACGVASPCAISTCEFTPSRGATDCMAVAICTRCCRIFVDHRDDGFIRISVV